MRVLARVSEFNQTFMIRIGVWGPRVVVQYRGERGYCSESLVPPYEASGSRDESYGFRCSSSCVRGCLVFVYAGSGFGGIFLIWM